MSGLSDGRSDFLKTFTQSIILTSGIVFPNISARQFSRLGTLVAPGSGMNLLITAVLCLLPLALVLTIIFRKRQEQGVASCAPFGELLRRPAGETLRIKLEALDEKLTDDVLGLILFPMLMVFVLFAMHPKDWIAPVFVFVISAASSALFGIRIFG